MSTPVGLICSIGAKSISKKEYSFFKQTNPLGFILFSRNYSNKKQIINLINELKNLTLNKSLFIFIDQEGGRVQRLKNSDFTIFPKQSLFGKMYKKNKVKSKRLSYLNAYLLANELKGVGENLQDHLMFRPIYKVQGLKSLNKKVNSLFGNLMIGSEYIFKRSGPMTKCVSQICMFAKSDPSLELPDLQRHVQPMSMDTLGATKNHDFHAFTPTVSNIRPTSRGNISIVDKDSRTYAKIKMNYLSTEHDRMVAAKGLKLTRKIVMESETFKKYKPEEYRPGININDDEELVKAGSDYAQTIFHPVGTCKMGQDDMAVVDDKLKVKGIKNLRVIDASIMPNITSGNTNAPTIMIAEKGADMILGN